MSDRVQIVVQGPEHTGKTTLMVLVAKYLESLGAEVTLQQADPEITEKLQKTEAELAKRVQKGVKVFIGEMQTA